MKSLSLILAALMLVVNVAPASAATLDLVVSGNGADSDNTVNIQNTNTTVVSQTNTTSINNDINATASTGGNSIDGTTGGSSVIDTGAANVDVTVTNEASSNVAQVDSCGCELDATVTIAGNGEGSENNAVLGSATTSVLSQTNTTNIDNEVTASSQTGDNDIEDTTGTGSTIVTGLADTSVVLDNTAGNNTASVHPGSSGGSSIDLLIKDNGADSDNEIKLNLATATVLSQLNQTRIDNDIWAKSKTGKNEINGTTGGSSGIGTGDATVYIDVSNLAGFNSAVVDGCDCVVTDVSAQIKNNGTDTKNKIKGSLSAAKVVSQSNTCGGYSLPSFFSLLLGSKKKCFDTNVGGSAATGSNEVSDGTGTGSVILTGLANFTVVTDNVGGSNVLGAGLLAE